METPLALPFDIPGTVSGEEEPLSFTLAPPTHIPETSRGRFPWWDSSLHLASKSMSTDQLLHFPQEPSASKSPLLS